MGLPCAKCAEMRAALEAAFRSFQVWLLTYADDMCEKADVEKARKEIFESGGTIAYISDVSTKVEKALSSDGGTLSAELKLLREFEGIYRNSPLDGDENVITFIRLVIPVIKKLDALRDWNSKQDSWNGEDRK